MVFKQKQRLKKKTTKGELPIALMIPHNSKLILLFGLRDPWWQKSI